MPRKALSPDLIGDLYEAALDETQWGALGNIIGRAAEVDQAGVWLPRDDGTLEMSMSEAALEGAALYAGHFYKTDLWQFNLRNQPRDAVWLAAEHTPEEELHRTEFYNDFLRKLGLARPLGCVLQVAPGVAATLAAEQTFANKLFDRRDKRRLEHVAPHVKRALQLRRRLQAQTSRGPLGLAALDALAFGMVVCNRVGHVRLANAAALQLARATGALTMGCSSRPLTARFADDTRGLARLIADAALGGAGGVMQIRGDDGVTALLVLVSPLPRTVQSGLGNAASENYALVSLRAAKESAPFTLATLMSMFNLTSAQAATALALYAGKAPDEIAVARGVKISTVRSHLAEIFARTGTESQRDLLRLLSRLPTLRATR